MRDRRLIDDVVTDYDERTIASSLPALPDPRSTARAVYDAVAGFGPLQRVDPLPVHEHPALLRSLPPQAVDELVVAAGPGSGSPQVRRFPS